VEGIYSDEEGAAIGAALMVARDRIEASVKEELEHFERFDNLRNDPNDPYVVGGQWE
jgi:hypothetical protein